MNNLLCRFIKSFEMINRWVLLLLHVLSLVLLGLGWTMDMLHINISTHFILDFKLFNEKRSVLGPYKPYGRAAITGPFCSSSCSAS